MPETLAMWPPRPLAPAGRLALDATPSVDGPWVAQLRTGLPCLDPLPGPPRPGAPHLATRMDPELPAEGYRLAVTATGVTVDASTPAGALQAATTVRQFLPTDAWRVTAVRRDDWWLPLVTVTDAPAHPYRGFMLDVARHFAPVPEVLRWLDLAAAHRLNRLHLHLTDDQGWRLPSQRYPAMAEVASWRRATWVGHSKGVEPDDPTRMDDTPHGGTYSLADLAEITGYASRLGITVVPEVDLPGHASALIAAIPEVGVPGCPPQRVEPRWGLLGRTVSPLPAAMEIVETLLGEAADAVASPYLHIGGDEADLSMWRGSPEVMRLAERHGGVEGLRGAVNARLATFVTGLGRTPIAWDDAFVAGGLPTQTVVMAWRSTELGRRAAAAGHDVVMTPVVPTYLDYAEAAGPDEPLSIGAPITVADAAGWTPAPAPAGAAGRVLGGQAQLWTEYAPDQAAREYRAFPRLSVLAANLWRGTPLDLGGEGDAVAAHEARLDALGVNRRPRTGPRPWQRPGAGRRAPVGVHPIEVVEAYLAEAAAQSEPPTHL